ncbi:MAG: D-alanyl-D-alanine carboxypeptidase [Rhizobiaceae bacterium]|nr:MAG: D-alanyl-D-alanine carboxypeptidase [Rhizobiaceae bacterium]CAG0958173.1 serine-type D-Ala-D-Ala carboxypeptidase (penicillin-binding protein 5/6) [Rhizobiaceae bacterium]
MARRNSSFAALGGVLFLIATGLAPAFASPSIAFDAATGRIVAHEDAFRRWHPASLTKLMTAYVTFRAIAAGELTLDSPIEVTKRAAAEPPAKMGYKPGAAMTLDNALKMLLIKSANDIAMAVGENVGGTVPAFVARMNGEAVRLGMTDTHFVNPNGLHDPAQYTTARDLGLLVMAIRREFPQYAPYFAIEGLVAGKAKMMSYNMLVGRYAGADGMKTGFVCASGFNMVGSATRNGRTLVAVVLGHKSALERTEAAAALLDRGFAGNAGDGATLASLPAYGLAGMPAPDMREDVCGKKKPAAAQSEAAADHEAAAVKSPWLEKLEKPKLVAVGLGGAKGPVPAAWAEARTKYADVPIPTPRPDYPPVTAQGDSATTAN